MSVATKNPFAVLEGGPVLCLFQSIQLISPEDSSSRPSSPPAAPPAIPAKSSTPPAARGNQRERGKGPASRGGRYYPRGGGANKPADATRDPAATTTEEPAAGAEGTKRRCKSLLPPASPFLPHPPSVLIITRTRVIAPHQSMANARMAGAEVAAVAAVAEAAPLTDTVPPARRKTPPLFFFPLSLTFPSQRL